MVPGGTSGLTGDPQGVISYGTLSKIGSGASAKWRPGHWISTNVNEANNLCGTGGALTPVAGKVHDAFAAQTCTSGVYGGVDTALLNATRSGFRDGHVMKLAPVSNNTEKQQRARILPVNFDVDQFQKALQNFGDGELGSYFGDGRFMKRDFNGVIFISSTWPGWDDGFAPRGLAKLPPIQGSIADNQQMGVTSPYQQAALPFPLCSDSALHGSGKRKSFDKRGYFKIPQCSTSTTQTAYPNSVRIINGSELDPKNFKSGLSIVSNLPVYITGGYNTKSKVNSNDPDEWMPAMVGGDQVTFFSDNWDDTNSPWSNANFTRKAIATTYNLGVISGWARSKDSVQVHSMPALMEDWQGEDLTFNGSIVIGFYPVFYRHGRYWDPTVTYAAGQRNISFDKHFGLSAYQPPGTPLFYISAVIDWKVR